MAVELQAPPESTSLVGTLKGILEDVQRLFSQQLSMLRAEIRADWKRSLGGLWPLAVGAALFIIGVPLLCVMAVHVIHFMTGAPDPAAIPLWACYGIVGGVITLLSIVMVMVGIRRFQSFNPLPDETARAFEENVTWLRKET
jgi:hypothetical protein